MEDEVDYMSDEFLNKCVDSKSDVRPGLLKTRNEKRQHVLMKKRELANEPKKKSTEVLQMETLEESLKQPINSANKGFSMLEKLGFKSGMGLGKNNTGIVEPIGINIKNDKRGLGFSKGLKKVKKESSKSVADNVSEADYRAFLSKKNKEREITSDLRKSQRMCRELDLKAEKSKPEEIWFWPDEPSESSNSEINDEIEDKEEIDLSNEEKLEMLTKHLRDNYQYCVWCKVQYQDEDDLKNCPGFTREDH